MIKEWLGSYQPANKGDAQDALREIMQAITLAGLSRAESDDHQRFSF